MKSPSPKKFNPPFKVNDNSKELETISEMFKIIGAAAVAAKRSIEFNIPPSNATKAIKNKYGKVNLFVEKSRRRPRPTERTAFMTLK